MIKIRIKNADHEIDVRFPISENELYAKLAEIHAIEEKDAPQSAFVTEVYWPEEFSMLKDRFANLDELNYLAKRMESFDYHEYDQFLIGITKLQNPTEKDLINLTFNLDHFTLCKDVSSYGKIGREYVMNTQGAVPANDEDDPKYAAIGKELIDKGLAQITGKGLLIYNPFDELTEVYDGQTFPEYYYENKLNEESVPRRHGTKLWYAFGIDYMLNNERYMGDALLQKKYTTDTLPFKKVKNRGERPKYYVENANPAIVSRETYSAVQELQKSRQKNVGGKKTSYPLTGMLRCPGCGRTYRRQLVRGKAYWMCSGRASGATICSSQRMSESDVYEAFNRMLFKLKEHHHAILGALIRDIEVMQSKTSENHEKIVEIDKEIADLAARNLVIVRLHTSGILNGSDYAAQSSEINNKISALRSERKRKLAEDEGNEQLDKLKELQGILDEYEPTKAFDEDLFHQIIEKAVVMSKSEIAFHLIGGLKLTETIA